MSRAHSPLSSFSPPFTAFSLLYHISPSFPRSLILSPFFHPSCCPYCSSLFFIVALAPFFSLLSLRNQMCSLYDLFRCRDWDWERLLQAECTLLEFKWLSTPPTVIPYANEFFFVYVNHVHTFSLLLTEEIASSVWTWHSFSRLILKTGKHSSNPSAGETETTATYKWKHA